MYIIEQRWKLYEWFVLILISFSNLSPVCSYRETRILVEMTTRDPNLDMTQMTLPELPNMRVEKHETEPDI